MIDNYNESMQEGQMRSYERYIGVSSIKVVAINPDNAKLRELGINVGEEEKEPVYVYDKSMPDGSTRKRARLRIMAQMQDVETNPIIRLDFTVGNDSIMNKDGSKCKVIDKFGNTAWVTRDELKDHKIPVDKNGLPIDIAQDYKLCHVGEEDVITFLKKLLCIAPYKFWIPDSGTWEHSAKPGVLSIDRWAALCGGDVSEISGYLSYVPNNCVKVILGIRRDAERGGIYQTFMKDAYLSNGASPVGGEYTSARKLINKAKERGYDTAEYSAAPVHVYTAHVDEPTPASDYVGSLGDGDPFASAPQPSAQDIPPVSNDDDLPWD